MKTFALPSDGTWRASSENGDKPGIGIELRRKGSALSGTLFVIDPNRPHDFRSGRAFSIRVDKDTGEEVVFTVQFATDNIQTQRLIFDPPANRMKLRGTLEPVPANGSKQEYIFRRIK
jgi:hypothetical protein